MKSLYKQYLNVGGTLSYKKWYRFIFNQQYHNYARYLDYINSNFDDVFIYDFEQFKKNQKEVVEDLCDFLDVSVPETIDYSKKINKSISEGQINLILFLNRISKTHLNKNGFLPNFCRVKILILMKNIA